MTYTLFYLYLQKYETDRNNITASFGNRAKPRANRRTSEESALKKWSERKKQRNNK